MPNDSSVPYTSVPHLFKYITDGVISPACNEETDHELLHTRPLAAAKKPVRNMSVV